MRDFADALLSGDEEGAVARHGVRLAARPVDDVGGRADLPRVGGDGDARQAGCFVTGVLRQVERDDPAVGVMLSSSLLFRAAVKSACQLSPPAGLSSTRALRLASMPRFRMLPMLVVMKLDKLLKAATGKVIRVNRHFGGKPIIGDFVESDFAVHVTPLCLYGLDQYLHAGPAGNTCGAERGQKLIVSFAGRFSVHFQ
jgi:hypothetical protein